MLFGLDGGVGIIYFTFTVGNKSTPYIGTRDVRKAGDPTYPQVAAEGRACFGLGFETASD